VFTYRGKPVTHMLNGAWRRARERVGLTQVRVHDLKHTLGRRLRAGGVGFEDRQDLLGHRSGRITTHYSAAELTRLIEAANRVCEKEEGRPELVILRRPSARARKEFNQFPLTAKRRSAQALTIAADGQKADIAKPMKGLGGGVFEIALKYRTNAYRVVYALLLGEAIWVVHAFQKKASHGIKTPKKDVDLIRERIKRLTEQLR